MCRSMGNRADVEEAAELFERVWIEGDDLEVGADPYERPSKVNTLSSS